MAPRGEQDGQVGRGAQTIQDLANRFSNSHAGIGVR